MITRGKIHVMETFEGSAFCPLFHRAIELIGGRWTGAILRASLTGVSTFSGFTSAIPGLSDRMLSERLRELEIEGLIERRVVPTRPVRIEYTVTEKGRALAGVMAAISEWAGEWMVVQPEAEKTPA